MKFGAAVSVAFVATAVTGKYVGVLDQKSHNPNDGATICDPVQQYTGGWIIHPIIFYCWTRILPFTCIQVITS